MKISIIDNHLNFKMALVRPSSSLAAKKFADEVGLCENKFVKRGLKQFINEQKNNSLDIVFNHKENSFDVIASNGQEVLSRFANTKTNNYKPGSCIKFIESCRYMLAPKSFLPEALIKAGKFATKNNKQIQTKFKYTK